MHFFWPQATRWQKTPNLQSKLYTFIFEDKINGNGCLSENNHQIKNYKLIPSIIWQQCAISAFKSKIINEYHQSFENNLHFFWPQATRRQTTSNLQSKLDTFILVVKTNGNGCLRQK